MSINYKDRSRRRFVAGGFVLVGNNQLFAEEDEMGLIKAVSEEYISGAWVGVTSVVGTCAP